MTGKIIDLTEHRPMWALEVARRKEQNLQLLRIYDQLDRINKKMSELKRTTQEPSDENT